MAKPAILAVDDDAAVVAAVVRDLRDALRRGLPRAARDVRRRGARDPGRPGAQGPAGRAVVSDQRMPGMTGIEVLQEVREQSPDTKLAAAHGVRRHRRRDPGDQRHRARLLPDEAVGPARGAALPGRSTTCCATGRTATPTATPRCASSATAGRSGRHEVKTFLTHNHVPYRWLDVERTRRRPGCSSSPAPASTTCRSCALPDGDALRSPTTSSSPTRSGCAPAPSSRSTTSASSAPGRPASPPRCTPPPRGCAPSSSSATPRAARPGRARRSRTTSASPRASPAPTSPTARWRRRRGSAPRWCWRATSCGFETRGPVRAVLLDGSARHRGAGRARGQRGVLPAARGPRPRRASSGAASTTAPARARRRRRGEDVYVVGRGQLGRPGGAQLRPLRQAGRARRARRLARGVDVAVPRQPDPHARPTSRCGCRPRSSARAATATSRRITLADRAPAPATRSRPAGCSSSSARPRAPTGSATTSCATASGFVVTGPDLPRRGLRVAAGPQPVRPRDERPRRLRRGRRAPGLDEAGRLGRRRGRDVGLPRPPLPGERHDARRRAARRPDPRRPHRRAGGRPRRGRRGGRRTSPASGCSTRAARPTTGGCCSTGRSTSSAGSATRRRCWRRWSSPASGPAASAPGTSTASTSASARVMAPSRVFRLPADAAGRARRDVVPLRGAPHRGLIDTVRRIEANARQREALVALGTLAAGLAHEINNPASAAIRSVDALQRAATTCSRRCNGSRPGHHRGAVRRPRRAAALRSTRVRASTGSRWPTSRTRSPTG